MNIADLFQSPRERPYIGYVWAFVGATIGSLVMSPFREQIDLSNVALLYVLGVVVMAVSFGRAAAVVTALYSALCFAYVFVPPHYSLAITEVQYLLSALIMLVVALIVGHLTSRLKQHADDSLQKSQSSRKLYLLAKELAGVQTPDEVLAATTVFLKGAFDANAVRLFKPDEPETIVAPANPALIRLSLEQRKILSRPTGNGMFYALLPLVAGSGSQGVLGLEVRSSVLSSQEALEYLETAASVISVAFERSSFAAIAHETELKHASEALRSSILAALSHDLRTPLTALVGMADNITLGKVSAEKQQVLLEAIRTQAFLISHQMTNLLDMARVSAGKLEPNAAWQPIEEVLGATLQQIGLQWKSRKLELHLAADLPPINIDAVLMERVLWNLIENAIKYSPEAEPVSIDVARHDGEMVISVCDRGSGIPEAQIDAVFETFHRGEQESVIPGVGLGLSIAKSIVEAHGGRLSYDRSAGGGSCFSICLPLGQPPSFDEGEDLE